MEEAVPFVKATPNGVVVDKVDEDLLASTCQGPSSQGLALSTSGKLPAFMRVQTRKRRSPISIYTLDFINKYIYIYIFIYLFTKSKVILGNNLSLASKSEFFSNM